MPLIRVITAYENETVEIVWTLRDNTRYVERHSIPPRDVVRTRQRLQGLSGAAETELPVPPVRKKGQASK